MKNNKCEKIMNEYLMLDKGEKVPLSLSFHILGCKKCRRQIQMLKMAEKQIARPLNIQAPVTDASIQKVIEQVYPEIKDNFYKPLPVPGWIIGGVIMCALLIFAIWYTSIFESRKLTCYYAYTLAGSITVYCAVFVFSHMDAFVKKLSTVIKNIA